MRRSAYDDAELFEHIGQQAGARREFFSADSYSFSRLGNVESRKERDELELLCRRLSWRKFAKKWWANATPEQKAKVYAYRQQWARENWGRVLESGRKAKRKRRAKPGAWAAELSEKRARRAAETQARRAELVYTCSSCGSQWCQLGRIPSRPPKYCTQACRARANYLRGKAAQKPWALRTKEHRADRGPRIDDVTQRPAETGGAP